LRGRLALSPPRLAMLPDNLTPVILRFQLKKRSLWVGAPFLKSGRSRNHALRRPRRHYRQAVLKLMPWWRPMSLAAVRYARHLRAVRATMSMRRGSFILARPIRGTQQAHLRQYGRKRSRVRQRAKGRKRPGKRQRAEAIGVPAKKLPGKEIKDDARIGNAKSHSDEVWRFLFGFGGLDEGRDKEEKETHELVEKFLDPETRERRSELEPQFNEQSSRGKRRRAALTMEFLKSKHGEIRRLRIIERGCEHAAWVKEITQQRRPPKPEPGRKGLKDLERRANQLLKEARPLKKEA
jgi:hypothetical protein